MFLIPEEDTYLSFANTLVSYPLLDYLLAFLTGMFVLFIPEN